MRELFIFLLGIWLGAPIGMLVMGFCFALRRNKPVIEDDQSERVGFSKAYYEALDAVSRTNLRLVKGDNHE